MKKLIPYSIKTGMCAILKIPGCTLLLWFSCICATAGVHKSAGTHAFAFLGIEYNARAVSMGGASIAVPDGSNDIVSNPAGQGFNKKNNFYLAYCPIFDEIQGLSGGVNYLLEKYGVIAISLISLSSGQFEVTDDIGGEPVATGETAGMNSIAGAVSWAYQFADYFSAGVAFRGIYDNISIPDEKISSSAIAVDLGIQYRFLRSRFIVGGVLKNIGYIVKQYDNTRYEMPVAIECGLSYVPSQLSNTRLAMDLSVRPGDFFTIRPGMEVYVYQKILALRVGFPFSLEDVGNIGDTDFTKTSSNGFAAGIGINPPIKNINTKFNFALQLRTSGLPPSLLISNTTEF